MRRFFKFTTYLLSITTFLFSCQEEEILHPSKSAIQNHQSTIIVGGEAIYAGYGYDPVEDRAYRNAIYPEAIYESTDIQPALEVSVEIINDQESIETFNSYYNVTTKTKRRFLGLSKKSITTSEKLESQSEINNTRIGVVAKITVKSQRFLIGETAVLIPPARRLLDQNQSDRFMDNYGPYYVADRTVGGEVYYTYVYEFCSINNWSKYEFKQKVKSSILKLFNKETTTNINSDDQQLINQSLENTSILSNIPGYAPHIIHSIDDANSEIRRIQNYLAQNPQKAVTIDMELKPYETIQENPELNSIISRKNTCLEHLRDWEKLYQKIHNLYIAAQNQELKQQAFSALTTIKQGINKSSTCSSSSFPTPSAYDYLLVETTKDTHKRPIHRYWNLGSGDHFYTHDFNELGYGRDGYAYEGVLGHMYSRQFIGTVAIHRYWNPRNTDHFYTHNFNEIGYGQHGYQYEGIIGYVYPTFDCGRKPIYRYWNSGIGDHFYTANYTELGGGAKGWVYEGIMGYLVP